MSRAEQAFPSGARVLVDGHDEAIVRQAFPDGSSSFLFAHYKVDLVGGDRNVAVAWTRVGVVRSGGSCGKARCGEWHWAHCAYPTHCACTCHVTGRPSARSQ